MISLAKQAGALFLPFGEVRWGGKPAFLQPATCNLKLLIADS